MTLYPNAFRGGGLGDCYGGNWFCAKHNRSLEECEAEAQRDKASPESPERVEADLLDKIKVFEAALRDAKDFWVSDSMWWRQKHAAALARLESPERGEG